MLVRFLIVMTFISHMVQMKGDNLFAYNSSGILYIPHGSDESRLKHLIRNSSNILYIPHGSDES